MSSIAKRLALLLVASGLAIECHAQEFLNLDFESSPVVREDPPKVTSADQSAPGWDFGYEYYSGAAFSYEELLLHHAYTPAFGPHIGTGPITTLGYGSFSLDRAIPWNPSLYALLEANPMSGFSYDSQYGQSNAIPEDYLYPVAIQRGVVPSNARSILIRTPGSNRGPLETLSVRLNGHRVALTPADPREYPDIKFWSIHEDIANWTFWVGNVESVAGLERELRVRPEAVPTVLHLYIDPVTLEPVNWDEGVLLAHPYFLKPSVGFDDIYFSMAAAPGPPVAVPEPTILAHLLLLASWRFYPRSARADATP